VEPDVQQMNPGGEVIIRTIDDGTRKDLADGQRTDRARS
jgi:hypothetical protein